MGNPILEITNVSKQYRLGYIGTGTLGNDINRWWQTSIRGKEDPYLKIGEENNRSQVGTSEYVWALKDINLQVQAGEVLGIIGANGAGKSTLLKILSRVTGPTTGKITARGRIASLLEVGTGFHGELTGRENIYLNGAILGMTKKEITSKLDEIIEFSGCERYIDTPVKRYSSGMYVRLAFAVAAHLEPEILIVDEVLAVGDAEFQKKAIGKMKDISSGDGRTVLFVSHNMDSISQLCKKSIILENGKIIAQGKTNEIIEKYITSQDITRYSIDNPKRRSGNQDLRIEEISLFFGEIKTNKFQPNDTIVISSTIRSKQINRIPNFVIGFGINNILGKRIVSSSSKWEDYQFVVEQYAEIIKVKIVMPGLPLVKGKYFLDIIISNGIETIDYLEHCAVFTIEDSNFSYGLDRRIEHGDIQVDCKYEIVKI